MIYEAIINECEDFTVKQLELIVWAVSKRI